MEEKLSKNYAILFFQEVTSSCEIMCKVFRQVRTLIKFVSARPFNQEIDIIELALQLHF
jgi:hypothetical protein